MKKHLLIIASLLGSNAVVDAADLASDAKSSSQLALSVPQSQTTSRLSYSLRIKIN